MLSLTFTQCTVYWTVTQSFQHYYVINLWLLCILFLLEVIRHVILCNGNSNGNGNGNGKSIHYYEPWSLMVHLWSQWQVINLGGYLEVIVSEVVQLVLTRQVWDPCPWWLRVVSFRKKIRYSDSSRFRKKIREHLYTLPLLVDHTLPLDIQHYLIYIGLGMAVKTQH